MVMTSKFHTSRPDRFQWVTGCLFGDKHHEQDSPPKKRSIQKKTPGWMTEFTFPKNQFLNGKYLSKTRVILWICHNFHRNYRNSPPPQKKPTKMDGPFFKRKGNLVIETQDSASWPCGRLFLLVHPPRLSSRRFEWIVWSLGNSKSRTPWT